MHCAGLFGTFEIQSDENLDINWLGNFPPLVIMKHVTTGSIPEKTDLKIVQWPILSW